MSDELSSGVGAIDLNTVAGLRMYVQSLEQRIESLERMQRMFEPLAERVDDVEEAVLHVAQSAQPTFALQNLYRETWDILGRRDPAEAA